MSEIKFKNNGNGKKYKIKEIYNSAIHYNANEFEDYLLDLYSLIL